MTPPPPATAVTTVEPVLTLPAHPLMAHRSPALPGVPVPKAFDRLRSIRRRTTPA